MLLAPPQWDQQIGKLFIEADELRFVYTLLIQKDEGMDRLNFKSDVAFFDMIPSCQPGVWSSETIRGCPVNDIMLVDTG